MTNKNIYDSLLNILRKESKGLAVSPDAFSDLLRDENYALFNEYYRAFEASQEVTDALRVFKTNTKLQVVYDGDFLAKYVALPSDYKHVIGIQSGIDLWFTWSNVADALGYLAWDTLTSSGRNITSAISALGSSECVSSTLSGLSASTAYTLYVNITDTSVSADSDMPHVYAMIAGAISSLTSLAEGLNKVTITTDVTGQFYLVFRALISKTVSVSATFTLIKKDDDDTIVPMDIVTGEEWMFRRKDTITAPSTTCPIAQISGGNIYVLPEDITSIILYYLKTPATPFFDYYYDDDYNIQYLAVGGTHVLTTGETGRSGEVAGATVTSSTVELEWEETEQIRILHRILAKLGVSMDEQLVAQYALNKERE